MKEITRILANGDSTNKPLFTVVTDNELLQKGIEIVRSSCGDVSEPGKGIIFVLSLECVEGLKEGD